MRINIIGCQSSYTLNSRNKNRQTPSFGRNVEEVSAFVAQLYRDSLSVVVQSSFSNNLEHSASQIRKELARISVEIKDTTVKTQQITDAKGQWLVLTEGRDEDPKSFKQIGKVYTAGNDGRYVSLSVIAENILKVLGH